MRAGFAIARHCRIAKRPERQGAGRRETSFRLADSIRTEPFLISHLVRIAILQITLQPVWEGLAEHRWSDAQLAELDSELAKLDFLADYELSDARRTGDCDAEIVD